MDVRAASAVSRASSLCQRPPTYAVQESLSCFVDRSSSLARAAIVGHVLEFSRGIRHRCLDLDGTS